MILTGLLLGAVLGYVLQRSRFCVTGAFRDLSDVHAVTSRVRGAGAVAGASLSAPFSPRRRSALVRTKTEESAIAPAASMGYSIMPVSG